MRRVLDVSVVASQTGIKAAYRKKALQLHPDVSNAPDATERFAELSSAYGEHHHRALHTLISGCIRAQCLLCSLCCPQLLMSWAEEHCWACRCPFRPGVPGRV